MPAVNVPWSGQRASEMNLGKFAANDHYGDPATPASLILETTQICHGAANASKMNLSKFAMSDRDGDLATPAFVLLEMSLEYSWHKFTMERSMGEGTDLSKFATSDRDAPSANLPWSGQWASETYLGKSTANDCYSDLATPAYFPLETNLE
ncbi:hypothetical protein CPB86DRAFT_803037 [Serendipita vermifera]|nr:hypothetical protein CPB86DRAFT_803037 [Serendipita vermifera]